MRAQTVVFHGESFEIFLREQEIRKAVDRLAAQINQDYYNQEVVVVGVLDGAFMVLADLLKRLKIRVSLELVKLKSYQGQSSSGTVHKVFGLTSRLSGAHILVVEDIIDSGKTLQYLLALLQEHEPASVRVATLLLKEEVFQNKFPIHYHGIPIPNKFVVGYGMDYDGQGRQLKDIYAIKQ